MTIDVDICNEALILVGADEVNTFTGPTADDSREAKLCAAFYATTVGNLISQHPWGFTMKQQTLTRLVATPEFGYEFKYLLPADFIRTVETDRRGQEFFSNVDVFFRVGSGISYRIVGRELYTNLDSLKLMYQFQPSEETFPVYFRSLLVLSLAEKLAFALFESESKAAFFNRQRREQLIMARNIDSQQQPNRAIDASNFSLVNVRF